MPDRIRIRAQHAAGRTEVLLLMPHPMETGLRKDDAGTLLPAHYITDLRVSAAGRVVLEARMSFAVSRDPLLRFRFRGGAVGEPLVVGWTDNRGERRSDETTIT